MAGLLDFYSDPRTMGLLSAASGLLSAAGPSRIPVSTGQAVGQGFMQGAQGAMQTQAFNQQQALQKEQLQALQIANALQLGKYNFFSGGGGAAPGPSANPMVPGLPTSSVMAGGGSYVPQATVQSQSQGTSIPTVPGLTPELSRAAALGWLAPGYVTAIASANKPFAGRSGAPIWGMGADGKPAIVGFSPKLPEGATMDSGGNVGVAPGYAQTVTQLGGIPNPSAPMQTIKLSDGREIQLTQPEYLRYSQSGGATLPSRYKSLGLPGVNFSDESSAAAAPAGPAVGGAPRSAAPSQTPPVVGATQSQTEQVQQAGETAAAKTTAAGLAQRKLEQPKDTTLLEDAVSKTDQAIDAAKAVLKHPGLGSATGATYLAGKLPGTKAFDAAQSLETLKGQIMLSVLQAMRSASANGSSGFGQLSNAEGEVLRNSLVSLQQAQSTAAVKQALKNVVDTLQGSRDRLVRGYERLYQEKPQIKEYHTNPSVPATKGAPQGFRVLGVEQ